MVVNGYNQFNGRQWFTTNLMVVNYRDDSAKGHTLPMCGLLNQIFHHVINPPLWGGDGHGWDMRLGCRMTAGRGQRCPEDAEDPLTPRSAPSKQSLGTWTWCGRRPQTLRNGGLLLPPPPHAPERGVKGRIDPPKHELCSILGQYI
jgi:hypothetical protein